MTGCCRQSIKSRNRMLPHVFTGVEFLCLFFQSISLFFAFAGLVIEKQWSRELEQVQETTCVCVRYPFPLILRINNSVPPE
jgi:predicted transporter